MAKKKESAGSRLKMDGKFFLSIKDEAICWQGQVLGEPRENIYLVQTYDWAVGGKADQCLVSLDEMRGWLFFDSLEELEYSYKYGSAYCYSSEFREREREIQETLKKRTEQEG